MAYEVYAINESGAVDELEYVYTSINSAAEGARSFYGKGWKVRIIKENGECVKEFKTRK